MITIPVRTIIEKINNALNKSKFKVGDIVYWFFPRTNIVHVEHKYEITEIGGSYVTLKYINSKKMTLKSGLITFDSTLYEYDRNWYEDIDNLEHYYSKTPKLF
jgi:hypothetical protein